MTELLTRAEVEDPPATLLIADKAGDMLLRIGSAPDFTFEWGDPINPDEAARVFAQYLTRHLREEWTRVAGQETPAQAPSTP